MWPMLGVFTGNPWSPELYVLFLLLGKQVGKTLEITSVKIDFQLSSPISSM